MVRGSGFRIQRQRYGNVGKYRLSSFLTASPKTSTSNHVISVPTAALLLAAGYLEGRADLAIRLVFRV